MFLKYPTLLLDDQDSDVIEIGILQANNTPLPEHEFFFHINRKNHLKFTRKEDLELRGKYYRYRHSVHSAYHKISQNTLHFISNKSIKTLKEKELDELFTEENEINYLLKNHKEITYIVKATDNMSDFCLILPFDTSPTQIQSLPLTKDSNLYFLIQNYE
ncbi:MAG: IPExxxVDY family protein [Bergeyella sp.]|nr:IPExxxVDY family protein [Bergeyella sp.]